MARLNASEIANFCDDTGEGMPIQELRKSTWIRLLISRSPVRSRVRPPQENSFGSIPWRIFFWACRARGMANVGPVSGEPADFQPAQCSSDPTGRPAIKGFPTPPDSTRTDLGHDDGRAELAVGPSRRSGRVGGRAELAVGPSGQTISRAALEGRVLGRLAAGIDPDRGDRAVARQGAAGARP